MISLPLLDVTHVEQARSVVRIELEPSLEIFARFVESPEMPVRKPHERVGARGGIHFDQRFELVDGFLGFPRHEIAFAERRAKIGALRSDLQTGFQQRNGIFKIILGHADPRKQENDVHILRSQLVGAHQHIQRVDGLFLLGVNLRHQVKRLRRIRLQPQRATQC